MDFSKLSEETMELSTQMGPRQQRLLFDQEFYDEEVTLEENSSEECKPRLLSVQVQHQPGPGVAFFVDIGSGSFCVRGLPVVENNLGKEDLIALNKHFEKAKEVQFFPV